MIGRIFDPLGNPVSDEFVLNTVAIAGAQRSGSVAALSDGGFLVAYTDNSSYNTDSRLADLRLERFDSAGNSVTINSMVQSASIFVYSWAMAAPKIEVSSASSVLVAYQVELINLLYTQSEHVKAKIYNPVTDSYGAEFQPFFHQLRYVGGQYFDTTVLTNGNYVFIADTEAGVYYSIVSSAGGTIQAETLLSDRVDGSANIIEAQALVGGGFVLVYENDSSEVVFTIFNNAGLQLTTGSLEPYPYNYSGAVGALADGSFIIAVAGDTTIVTHVSAAGSILGTQTLSIQTDYSSDIQVQTFADGRFAIVSHDQDANRTMEIFDTRDLPNAAPGAYTPDQWVVGTINNDVFTAATGTDVIHGWNGNDRITEATNSGSQDIYGDAGTDYINVTTGIGTDYWDGGTGVDTIDWRLVAASNLILDLTAGTARSGSLTELMVNFENLVGTQNADDIRGNGVANSLTGLNGNDKIIGLAGADTLDGGAGVDSLDGGTGDDIIFYDAADNLAQVLGGANIDTLVFTAGAAPTTFNLTAHQFEKAEGRFDDPGNNAWKLYVNNYDSAWRLTHQTGIMDDGRSYYEDYDELSNQTWTRITYWNDALGRPDAETGQLDDGRAYDSDHDNGNLYSWTRIDYWRDALGRSDVETGFLDDGRSYNSDLDNGDAYSWDRIDNWADSLGRLDYQNGKYDADDTTRPGWSWQVDYDQANQFTWSRVERFWNSAGVLQSETFF